MEKKETTEIKGVIHSVPFNSNYDFFPLSFKEEKTGSLVTVTYFFKTYESKKIMHSSIESMLRDSNGGLKAKISIVGELEEDKIEYTGSGPIKLLDDLNEVD